MHFVLFKRETFEFAVIPEQVTYLAKSNEEQGTRISFTGGNAILVSEPIQEVVAKLANALADQ